MPVPASAMLTVDTTKTTSSTSTKSSAARKGPRIRTIPSVIQLAASQWKTMNGHQRSFYAALSAQIATQLEPSILPHKSAYSTFVQLASANCAAGQIQPASAMPYAPAPLLPAAQVVASFAGGLLTLTLVPSAPYAYPIAIKAARSILTANDIYKSTTFK